MISMNPLYIGLCFSKTKQTRSIDSYIIILELVNKTFTSSVVVNVNEVYVNLDEMALSPFPRMSEV